MWQLCTFSLSDPVSCDRFSIDLHFCAGNSHAGVYMDKCEKCDTITRGCARALVCSQFVHSRWGTRPIEGWGDSTCVCRALVAWHRGLFDTEEEIEVLSCVLLFLTQVGVYVCVRVCIRTYTHTLHMGCLMWAQGLGWDTWRARRIQMD